MPGYQKQIRMIFFENHSLRSPGPIFPKFGLIDTIDVHRIITPERTKGKLWGIEMLGMLDMGKGVREEPRRLLIDNQLVFRILLPTEIGFPRTAQRVQFAAYDFPHTIATGTQVFTEIKNKFRLLALAAGFHPLQHFRITFAPGLEDRTGQRQT